VKDKRRRPWLSVMTGGESLVSHVGGSLLVATAGVTGLCRELSAGLGSWRARWAIHDPGKIVLDLAVAVALGGDCAADIAVLRAQPGVFELVASDPTVSRLVATLARDVDAALGAITAVRGAARQRVWAGRGHQRRTDGW
jgi:DDE family transposase